MKSAALAAMCMTLGLSVILEMEVWCRLNLKALSAPRAYDLVKLL